MTDRSKRDAEYRAKNADKIRASRAAYNAAHREEARAYSAAYYASHREESIRKQMAWQAAHPERTRVLKMECHRRNAAKYRPRKLEYAKKFNATPIARAMKVAWRRSNPHVVAAIDAKRRALQRQATPLWADQKAIAAIYQEAQRRTRETGIAWQVDHFYPLVSDSMCGLHVEANLRVITAHENQVKNNRVVAHG